MKKFVFKASIFTIPFLLLYSLNVFYFNQEEGDLVRLGLLYSNPSPKSKIINKYSLARNYPFLSEKGIVTQSKYDVLTIGDSFSDQDSLGYQNFLASKGKTVLHVDKFISKNNPIQFLVQLLNSNAFDYIHTDFIIIQSVERYFNERIETIDFDKSIDLDVLSEEMINYHKKSPNYNLHLFSDATLKCPLNNIEFLFTPKPKYSLTYKYKSSSNDLFSNNPDDLLFYQGDINKLNVKNDSLKVLKGIKVLNKINNLANKKGIQLIVLISPDKYDLYFQYIKYNANLVRPLFFNFYNNNMKKYKDVNSYQKLSEGIKKEKDIYFYDDTHWSPKGAKIIADELYKIMEK